MAECKKIKLVIWDLDNTIWDGVLSEDTDLVLRKDIITIIKTLDNRGILQSIASKNNYEQAMDEIIKWDLQQYFLYPQIDWNSKSSNLKEIIKRINIGSDAVAFIDDQEFERNEVAYYLPQVICIDAKETKNLLTRDDMQPEYITEDTRMRRRMYQENVMREDKEKEFEGTQEKFLSTLNMELTISDAKEVDLERALELTVRTHQLNSTGYTYSFDELKSYISNDRYKLLVAELKDTYGSYGKIGLALIEKKVECWQLKLLLTSCRVMSRGIGSAMLGYIINLSIDNKKDLIAEFVPNDRNRIMAVTYSMLGFRHVSKDGDKQILEFKGDKKWITPNYLKLVI